MRKVILRICFYSGILVGSMALAQPVSANTGMEKKAENQQNVSLQAKKWNKRNWYKKVLRKQKGSYKTQCWNYANSYDYKKVRTKLASYSYYKVADINGDGTRELLLSTSSTGQGFESQVLVLTYRSGKVKPLILFDSLRNGLFLRDGKMYAQVGGSTESIITGYKIKNGKAKQFVKLERLRRWLNGSLDEVTTYWKNGKQISEAKYNTECEKTVAYQTPVSFSKIQ